jgi:hypothetical protein
MQHENYEVWKVNRRTNKKLMARGEAANKDIACRQAEIYNNALTDKEKAEFEFEVFPGRPFYRIVQGGPVRAIPLPPS